MREDSRWWAHGRTRRAPTQRGARPEPVVFVLWGGYARKKSALIDASRHVIIESAHPSPLSARNGFFGSKPYSSIPGFARKRFTLDLRDLLSRVRIFTLLGTRVGTRLAGR